MKISENGIKLLKSFEGCKLEAYKDQAGVWTIGYGSTMNVSEGMVITQEQAEERLTQYLSHLCANIDNLIRVPINQNQFDAVCCFTYNVGLGNFSKSHMLGFINHALWHEAADEFPRWNRVAGVVNQGLVNRRAAERALFIS